MLFVRLIWLLLLAGCAVTAAVAAAVAVAGGQQQRQRRRKTKNIDNDACRLARLKPLYRGSFQIRCRWLDDGTLASQQKCRNYMRRRHNTTHKHE